MKIFTEMSVTGHLHPGMETAMYHKMYTVSNYYIGFLLKVFAAHAGGITVTSGGTGQAEIYSLQVYPSLIGDIIKLMIVL